jgi:hypothetical protein
METAMSDPEQFDTVLAERFDREHQHISADAFVASAMHRIRFQRRLAARIHAALRVAVLIAAIVASPWLIAGATRLNAALASALSWTGGLPGVWMLGALAAVVFLASRLRSR